jgi:hypothetical protein
MWAVEVPSNYLFLGLSRQLSSRGRNLGNAKPVHFAQGHAYLAQVAMQDVGDAMKKRKNKSKHCAIFG